MVMLACQTDFSANTDGFGALADQLCAHVAKHRPDTPDSLLSQKFDGASETIDETIKGLAGKIGENIRVARIAVLDNGKGRIGGYLHHDQKQGALISLTTSADAAKTDAYLRQLGMHIVSMRPLAARGDEVDAKVLERERSVYLDSDEVKAKPEEHRAKIVEGKLKKFLAGVALTEQPWVLDPKQTVQQALEATLGKDARIEAFELFAIGG
jgi:elongation factor Ts